MKNKIYKAVIIVLSIILAINICNIVVLTVEDLDRYKMDEDTIVYTIDDRNYDYLVSSIYKIDLDEASEIEEDAYYLASYYESAVLYRAYLNSEDKERAKIYEEKMNEHKGKITLFSYHIDIIDDMLGLS